MPDKCEICELQNGICKNCGTNLETLGVESMSKAHAPVAVQYIHQFDSSVVLNNSEPGSVGLAFRLDEHSPASVFVFEINNARAFANNLLHIINQTQRFN
jgi:hypothetical protein